MRGQDNLFTPDDFRYVEPEPLTEIRQSDAHFIINKWILKPTPSLIKFRNDLDSILREQELLKLHIESSASPDGPIKWNVTLAKNRARVMKEYLQKQVDIPDSLIEILEIPENWDGLRKIIVADTTLPNRREMIELIDSDLDPNTKEVRLRRLAGGKPFDRLKPEILPALRYSFVRAVTPYDTLEYDSRKPWFPPVDDPRFPILLPDPHGTITMLPIYPKLPYIRHWYLSTNAIGIAMGITNLAGEVDIAKHWTARLALSHCGWDYVKSTIKFRNAAAYPEIRWFSRPNNTGFFINAHAGVAYYNFAFDGDKRYQDRDGRHPTFGGGIGIGGRWFISADRHWMLEAAVGGGIYPLDYDVFDNTPNVKDGLKLYSKKKTYYGFDQAAISIVYRFGPAMFSELKKGGVVK